MNTCQICDEVNSLKPCPLCNDMTCEKCFLECEDCKVLVCSLCRCCQCYICKKDLCGIHWGYDCDYCKDCAKNTS